MYLFLPSMTHLSRGCCRLRDTAIKPSAVHTARVLERCCWRSDDSEASRQEVTGRQNRLGAVVWTGQGRKRRGTRGGGGRRAEATRSSVNGRESEASFSQRVERSAILRRWAKSQEEEGGREVGRKEGTGRRGERTVRLTAASATAERRTRTVWGCEETRRRRTSTGASKRPHCSYLIYASLCISLDCLLVRIELICSLWVCTERVGASVFATGQS